jgi:hypothetical protein
MDVASLRRADLFDINRGRGLDTEASGVGELMSTVTLNCALGVVGLHEVEWMKATRLGVMDLCMGLRTFRLRLVSLSLSLRRVKVHDLALEAITLGDRGTVVVDVNNFTNNGRLGLTALSKRRIGKICRRLLHVVGLTV